MIGMKIALLFGGKSFEHDISIITTNIIYHALKDKHDLFLIYIDKEGIIRLIDELDLDNITSGKKYKTINFINHGFKRGFKKYKIDVMISLMHGINGEDGLASNIANLFNIPYVGSNNISSAVLMDKYFSYAILSSLCINVINTQQLLESEEISNINYPMIVKPARLGSSIGIKKIVSENELESCLDDAFKFDSKLIIQPYINNFKEYNQAAYIFKGEVVVSNVEEVFKNDDILSFDDKYLSDTNKKHIIIKDKEFVKKVSEITRKIYTEFELSGVVRIDYMFFDNKVYVNEINTTPGSLAYYLFKEPIDILLEKIIENSLYENQNKRMTNFTTSVLHKKYSYKK